MDLVQLLINDPIVLYSFIGLAVLLGICGYYIYYFIKHIQQDKK